MFDKNEKQSLNTNPKILPSVIAVKNNQQTKQRQIKYTNLNVQNLAEHDQIVLKFDPKKFIQKLNLGAACNIKEWDESEVDKKTMDKIAQFQKQYKQQKQKMTKNSEKQRNNSVTILRKNNEFNNKLKPQIKESPFKKIPIQPNGKLAKKGGKDFQPLSNNNLLNVGALSFRTLGKQCFKKNILNEELFKQFQKISSEQQVSQFVQMFDSGNIKNKDFSNKKITIMDHRRMCEYLVKFCPQHYYYEQIKYDDPNVKKFLQNLFSLKSKQYEILINSLDSTSSVTWWNNLQLRYQKSLIERKDKSKPKYQLNTSKNIDNVKKQNKTLKKQHYTNRKDLDRQLVQEGKKRAYNKQYDLDSSSLSSEEHRTQPKVNMNIPRKKIFK